MLLFISIILMGLFYIGAFELLAFLFSPPVAIFLLLCICAWVWVMCSEND